MSAEIIPFAPDVVGDGITLDPDTVLAAAMGNLDAVAIAGLAADGSIYVATSCGASEAIVMIERAKMVLVCGFGDMDE